MMRSQMTEKHFKTTGGKRRVIDIKMQNSNTRSFNVNKKLLDEFKNALPLTDKDVKSIENDGNHEQDQLHDMVVK